MRADKIKGLFASPPPLPVASDVPTESEVMDAEIVEGKDGDLPTEELTALTLLLQGKRWVMFRALARFKLSQGFWVWNRAELLQRALADIHRATAIDPDDYQELQAAIVAAAAEQGIQDGAALFSAEASMLESSQEEVGFGENWRDATRGTLVVTSTALQMAGLYVPYSQMPPATLYCGNLFGFTTFYLCLPLPGKTVTLCFAHDPFWEGPLPFPVERRQVEGLNWQVGGMFLGGLARGLFGGD